MKKIIILFIFTVISILSYSQNYKIKEVHEAKDSLVKVCINDSITNKDSIIYFTINELNQDNEYIDFALMLLNYVDEGETIKNCVYQMPFPQYLTEERLLIITNIKGYIVNTTNYGGGVEIVLSINDYKKFKKLFDLVKSKINQ